LPAAASVRVAWPVRPPASPCYHQAERIRPLAKERSLAMLPRASTLLLALIPIAAGGLPADWPQWRGPDADGASPETGLPLTWSASEGVIWKLALPEVSGSTPIVAGDRLYLSVAQADQILLWSVDRKAGTLVWSRPLAGGNEAKRKGNLSSPSPTADGDTVWATTGTGVVAAFDREGKELWRRDLQKDYGPFGILHGYASSPLLLEDLLVVQVLHGFATDDPSYLVGLDRRTGATRWRVERATDAPREAPDAYTTPALWQRGGKAEIVVSGADYVTGHDPASGRELWRVAGLNPDKHGMYRVVASPLVQGDLLVTPSRVKPMIAWKAGAAGGPPVRLWSTDDGPDVPTPASDGTYLYVLGDRGVVWCLELQTGKPVWGPERVATGSYSASPLVAEGRVYVTSEEGVTTVLAAGREFRVLAENAVGEYTLSSLAAAGGQLFLRTAKHLYCLDDGKGP
jgi:outer membrane protein assembly factor BamB